MQFLSVQNSKGEPLGRILLPDEINEFLKKEPLLLSGVYNKNTGKFYGYTLSERSAIVIVPPEEPKVEDKPFRLFGRASGRTRT